MDTNDYQLGEAISNRNTANFLRWLIPIFPEIRQEHIDYFVDILEVRKSVAIGPLEAEDYIGILQGTDLKRKAIAKFGKYASLKITETEFQSIITSMQSCKGIAGTKNAGHKKEITPNVARINSIILWLQVVQKAFPVK